MFDPMSAAAKIRGTACKGTVRAMQFHLGLGSLRAEWPGATVVVGTFDGVHLGHAQVISTAVSRAHAREEPAVLVTFDRHPATVLAPGRVPPPVAGLEENMREIRALGVSVTVVLAFDAAFSRMSAERFHQEILLDGLRAKLLVVGHDFAMGDGREGTAEWLAARTETVVVPPYAPGGLRVSSTAVREAVAAGEMERAAELLGRPFAIRGVVVPGKRLGRTIGYPTANLARSIAQVEPPNGVYAGWADTVRGRFRAAIGVGTRPTVAGVGRTVEPYLLDYPGDSLYGTEIRLELHRRLRNEEKFASLDDLKAQMARDVEETRTIPA